MATKIQLRRDTAANWTTNNPILSEGEIGYDSTNKSIKVGDGTTAWDILTAVGDSGSVDLTGYATETFVQSEISANQPDLSSYALSVDIAYPTKVLEDYVEDTNNVGTTNLIQLNPAVATIYSVSPTSTLTLTADSGWSDGQTVSVFATNSGTKTVSFSGAKFARGDNEIVDDAIISITKVAGTYWVSISGGYS